MVMQYKPPKQLVIDLAASKHLKDFKMLSSLI